MERRCGPPLSRRIPSPSPASLEDFVELARTRICSRLLGRARSSELTESSSVIFIGHSSICLFISCLIVIHGLFIKYTSCRAAKSGAFPIAVSLLRPRGETVRFQLSPIEIPVKLDALVAALHEGRLKLGPSEGIQGHLFSISVIAFFTVNRVLKMLLFRP